MPDTPARLGELAEADAALLRDLIDRRADLNAVALRPGQAVHAHALERLLAREAAAGDLVREVAALRTFPEMCADMDAPLAGDEDVKPHAMDDLIERARELVDDTAAPFSTESAIWKAVNRLTDEGWIDAPSEDRRRELAHGFMALVRETDDPGFFRLPLSSPLLVWMPNTDNPGEKVLDVQATREAVIAARTNPGFPDAD